MLDDELVGAIKDRATIAVEDAVTFAKGSGVPDPAAATSYVFAEGSPR